MRAKTGPPVMMIGVLAESNPLVAVTTAVPGVRPAVNVELNTPWALVGPLIGARPPSPLTSSSTLVPASRTPVQSRRVVVNTDVFSTGMEEGLASI